MERLLLLGLNHATAPLSVREKLAFSAQQRGEALAAFKARFPEAEAVLLSTCNRVELYAARPVHGQPRVEAMIEFLATMRQVEPTQFKAHVYEKTQQEVASHLFTVVSSLDSMVLGETQILGQVREAYEAACNSQVTGSSLNPLFQKALAVGKHVMSATPIAEGRMSVASVAVDYARRIFDKFADKTVLCIGAGKMANLVLQSFAGLHPKRLIICNRDLAKAQTLVGKFGGEAIALDNLSEHLASADIVITSTGSPLPILTRAHFEAVLKQRRYKPIFVIDIALPRDVEESAGKLEHVYLYNIDDLQHAVQGTQSQRREAVDQARAIVAREVENFVSWQRQRELGPMIEKLYARYRQVAREELERTLHKLGDVSPEQRAQLEEHSNRLVNKLLHDPIHMLRHGENLHGGAIQYLHAMEKLFRLDEDAAGESKPD